MYGQSVGLICGSRRKGGSMSCSFEFLVSTPPMCCSLRVIAETASIFLHASNELVLRSMLVVLLSGHSGLEAWLMSAHWFNAYLVGIDVDELFELF